LIDLSNYEEASSDAGLFFFMAPNAGTQVHFYFSKMG
jgi:hypothetical protein